MCKWCFVQLFLASSTCYKQKVALHRFYPYFAHLVGPPVLYIPECQHCQPHTKIIQTFWTSLFMIFVWLWNLIWMRFVCSLYEIWVLYDFCIGYEICMTPVWSLYEVCMIFVWKMGFVWVLNFWMGHPFYTTTKYLTNIV